MNAPALKVLALIEDHHVAHGLPSNLEMQEIRAAMDARGETEADPETLAHDTFTDSGWRVETIDGVIAPPGALNVRLGAFRGATAARLQHSSTNSQGQA